MAHGDSDMSRRALLKGAAAAVTWCVLDCVPAAAQAPAPAIGRALDDPAVSHGPVSFDGGREKIGGYLSHPKKDGRFPAVLVITGSSLADEYIPNTTAMLAKAGFVGFAPDIFALQQNAATPDERRQILADEITDSTIYGDLDAAVRFLRTQAFVNGGKIGATGFCFGGRCALMYATHSRDVGAVAPFYGNLKTPAFAKRSVDPIDVPDKILAPVQGHYARVDDEIPLDQLSRFEAALKLAGARADFYLYDAPHGFFAYNRSTYNEAAARTAWQRTTGFLHRELGS
jgi:carboxymethylenebutenolidase